MSVDTGFAMDISDEQAVINYTEHLQDDYHKMIDEIMANRKGRKKISYQDATNVYLFNQLAKIIVRLNKIETK